MVAAADRVKGEDDEDPLRGECDSMTKGDARDERSSRCSRPVPLLLVVLCVLEWERGKPEAGVIESMSGIL